MRIPVLAGALLALAAAMPASAADVNHGKQVFKTCAACHNENGDQESLGPSLNGVYGRKAGSLADFRYSNAMRRSGLVWNEANLRKYVANPQATVKGNHMPFGGLDNAADVNDVVAYLKTLK